MARVKRWGKSPPLRWRHRRHGKPRVVQGQIGGESRPGSPRTIAQWTALRPPLQKTFFLCGGGIHRREQPSGRLLEPWCESRPRGMIAAGRCFFQEEAHRTESGLQARPPHFDCCSEKYPSVSFTRIVCPAIGCREEPTTLKPVSVGLTLRIRPHDKEGQGLLATAPRYSSSLQQMHEPRRTVRYNTMRRSAPMCSGSQEEVIDVISGGPPRAGK